MCLSLSRYGQASKSISLLKLADFTVRAGDLGSSARFVI